MSGQVQVLIVDDSEFFGTVVSGELERRYDMETRRTESAQTALKYVERGEFDCVVSDYDMPEMDGIELFHRMRERGSEIPFFLLTAAGSEAVASEAITAGVSDYFPKARGEEQFEILGKRIENVVEQRRAQEALDRQRRLHETLWEVTQELMHAPTTDEIASCVCSALLEDDRIELVWLETTDDGLIASASSESTSASDELVREVRECVERHNDGHSLEIAPGEGGSIESATAETPLFEKETEVLAVPLRYRGSTYGASLVATESGRFSSPERESLAHLGTTVGHALAAVEMRREVEIFREAVEQADPAVLITDTDGRIEYANTAFSDVTGYDIEDALGSPVSMLATPDWDESYYEEVWEDVRNGAPVRQELTQRRADGAQFHADLSVAPIEVDGECVKFVLIVSDITTLKSREQRLQVLNRVIRHNLRNDLNAAQGYLSLLVDDVEDETLETYAQRAEKTITDLLSVAEKAQFVNKMVDATSSEDQQVVDLGAILEEELDAVTEQYPHATVSSEYEKGLQTQGAHLHGAIHELLVNAIEHNDSDDPRVAVSTTLDAELDVVHVDVEDNGPGIPDLERETLEKGRETDLAHGSSLGLWLVHWIVTHVGGDLDISESALGGTCVRLSLPLVRSDGQDT